METVVGELSLPDGKKKGTIMSNYTQELTWNDWLYRLQENSAAIATETNKAYNQFKKWYDYSYGKTNADIATALNIDESKVVDVQATFTVFKELFDALNNTAVTTDDRLTKLLKFV